MEADCASIPEAFEMAGALADRGYYRSLWDDLVFHVFESLGVLVVGSAAGATGRNVFGACVHHLSRLRSWVVFQISQSERCGRLCYRLAHVHALLSMAMGSRHTSRHFRPSRQAWHWRPMDLDGAGISGIVTLETLRLPPGEKSSGALRDCPAGRHGVQTATSHPQRR